MKKKRPPIYKYKFRKVSKEQFLTEVITRLEDDVSIYFEKAREVSKPSKYVGFWASARLLFPIIEAVADTLFRKTEIYENRPQRLLEKLNVPAPYLVWQMYRNSLMHTEGLITVRYNGKEVTWMIGYGAGSHFEQKGMVSIDTLKLYQDLHDFLKKEIKLAKEKTTYVYVPTTMQYSRNLTGSIKDELKIYSQNPGLPIHLNGGITNKV